MRYVGPASCEETLPRPRFRRARGALLGAGALLLSNPLAVWCCAPRVETLPPGATLVVAGRVETLHALARRHVPVFYDDPAIPGGPLREALYEARAAGGRLSILYRTVWDDEVHPVPAIDCAYRLARRIYFGTVRDVEYVRVDVNLASGRPVALEYQPEPTLSRDELTSAHFHTIERDPALPIELYVVSWNHLVSRLGAELPGRAFARAFPEVRPVTDADRWRLWLARATYSELADFGPLSLAREAPLHLGALLLAWAIGRPRWGRGRQAPCATGRA